MVKAISLKKKIMSKEEEGKAVAQSSLWIGS